MWRFVGLVTSFSVSQDTLQYFWLAKQQSNGKKHIYIFVANLNTSGVLLSELKAFN
jgi:hypothetical protein